jgi:hypothetical protein
MKVLIELGRMALLFLVLLSNFGFAYNLTDGLVGYYQFENNYTDMSPYGNNGTANGTVSFVTGYNGSGLEIDSVDAFIDIGNDTSLQLTDNFTIGSWVYLGSSPIWQSDFYFFFSKGYTGEFDCYYAYTSGELRVVRNSATSASGGSTTKDGWVYITFRSDGGNISYYENGSFVTQIGTNTDTISATTNHAVIGNRATDGDYSVYGSNMTMDNTGFWNRALSDIEILALSGGEEPYPTPPTTTTSSTTTTTIPEVIVGEYCYQEQANQSQGCGTYDTGTYYSAGDTCYYTNNVYDIFDGNWTAGVYCAGLGFHYVNYTVPANASEQSLWQIAGDDYYILNVSIPSDCWNSSQLRFRIDTRADFSPLWNCWNETLSDWSEVYTNASTTSSWAFEEGMWWFEGTTTTSTTTTITPTTTTVTPTTTTIETTIANIDGYTTSLVVLFVIGMLGVLALGVFKKK